LHLLPASQALFDAVSTGRLPVPSRLVSLPRIGVNGNVLGILSILFAVSAATQNPAAGLPSPARQLTACSIVTKADVEQAIGLSVSDGTEEIQGKSSTCDYGTKTGLISITIQKLTNKPDLKNEILALKKEIPEGVVRDAPGFPEAFYLDIPDAGTQLHIVNGGFQHLMISILGFGDASEVSGVAVRIARKAMSRL
jgi:hypothetical protein